MSIVESFFECRRRAEDEKEDVKTGWTRDCFDSVSGRS